MSRSTRVFDPLTQSALRKRPRPTSSVTPPSQELIATFIAHHNGQEQSLLVSRLPVEIRTTIFLYALSSYEDLSTVYPYFAHTSQPQYCYISKVDTRLLRTCRLIYLEARFLPVKAKEHTLWCRQAPPGIYNALDPSAYFSRFTEEQKNRIDRVHIFAQQYFLERDLPRVCKQPHMRPRLLKITIRHSDWWWYDKKLDEPLRLKDGWADGLKHLKRLQEVVLELETMEKDKEQVTFLTFFTSYIAPLALFQMIAIATYVSRETFVLDNGNILSTANNPIVFREWIGPRSIFENAYERARRILSASPTSSISQNSDISEDTTDESAVPDPGIKYCVALVRWTTLN
ncbi:hypothetical protein F5880DRAFT_1476308 [Lentinula raphanica]|nr:hypothetical protein F5880DRAFT_1476308 [Lentinula raphanica]